MTLLWAVILFGLLIFFHELGHFIFAKLMGVKVLKFSLGFGPTIIGKKIGETEYVISAIPLGGYVKPLGEDIEEELSEEDKPRAFNYQPVWKRVAIVVAGPVFNFVLALIIFISFLGLKLPVAIPKLDSLQAKIENVMEDSPAMKAGILPDDTIVEINGSDVQDWNEMAEIFSASPGKELKLTIRRGDDLINLAVVPEAVKATDGDGKEITVGKIGISKKLDVHLIEADNIFEAPFKGLQAVWEWSVLTLEVVVKLFSGSVSAKQVGGPILIVDAAAKAASVGAFAYFNFIAIISINLAILNLFPVPVLDGGHVMFMCIEALRGRPLSERFQIWANKVGMALLFMLIAFVFYNDIVRIIVPWVQKSLLNN
ncbi:MAG: RIP metalloprotease RseP [Nitrospiraceae bacterium]|nr:MAG: RIP metalloprotease RseP [Nitrospiraceae bacterium]